MWTAGLVPFYVEVAIVVRDHCRVWGAVQVEEVAHPDVLEGLTLHEQMLMIENVNRDHYSPYIAVLILDNLMVCFCSLLNLVDNL